MSSPPLPATSITAKDEFMPTTHDDVARCSDMVGVVLELVNSFVALLPELGKLDPFWYKVSRALSPLDELSPASKESGLDRPRPKVGSLFPNKLGHSVWMSPDPH